MSAIFAAESAVIMGFIHELAGWPGFTWDTARLALTLADVFAGDATWQNWLPCFSNLPKNSAESPRTRFLFLGSHSKESEDSYPNETIFL